MARSILLPISKGARSLHWIDPRTVTTGSSWCFTGNDDKVPTTSPLKLVRWQHTNSNTTRGAMAATSRNVKQKLVRLLFHEKYSRTGPQGHKRLDFSIYSYEDLRKAYLERLQIIHPDKQGHNRSEESRLAEAKCGTIRKNYQTEFQELQSTWDQYEELSKNMRKVQGDGVAANFTKFGVGCSFSDNDEERALRNEITDQACRGWFSSGLLGSSIPQKTKESKVQSSPSLLDDTMFVVEDKVSDKAQETRSIETKKTTSLRNKRKTLIPGIG